jgi:hypothetical protein
MGAYLSSHSQEPVMTVSITGRGARELADKVRREIIRENRRRAHHGDSRIRYTVLFEEEKTYMTEYTIKNGKRQKREIEIGASEGMNMVRFEVNTGEIFKEVLRNLNWQTE